MSMLSNCPKCGADLIVRTGRYGPFKCCPNSRPGDNHFTESTAPKQRTGWALRCGLDVDDQGETYDMLRPY